MVYKSGGDQNTCPRGLWMTQQNFGIFIYISVFLEQENINQEFEFVVYTIFCYVLTFFSVEK